MTLRIFSYAIAGVKRSVRIWDSTPRVDLYCVGVPRRGNRQGCLPTPRGRARRRSQRRERQGSYLYRGWWVRTYATDRLYENGGHPCSR